MNRIRTRRPYFGAFSFTFIYCWYIAYGRYFEASPVAASLRSWGFAPQTLEAMIFVGVVAGVAVALCTPWPRLVEHRWPLKLLMHVLAFIPFQLFTLFSNAGPIIALALLGGFCLGAITGRSFYLMFFEIMDIHPAKVVVIGYAFIQAYVHLSEIIPLGSIPLLYFGLESVTLLAGLALSFLRRDGDEMERRRILPENSFRLADIWQVLGMIVLIQICLTLYEFVILQQTARSMTSDAIKVIPTVLKLVLLALIGKRLTLVGTLVAFLTLFFCSVGAFIIFEQEARIPVQLFMEPAYGLLDFLFVWILAVVFYTYGRSQLRLKACITVFFAVRFATIIGCQSIFSVFEPTEDMAFFVLFPAIIAALFIPITERAVKSMEARRTYAEQQEGPSVPLPPEREEVKTACENLMRALPMNEALTEGELAALAYLIDGHYSDVTASFMDIPDRVVRELNRSVYRKFGVKSIHELMILLGSAQARTNNSERRQEVFDRCGLTEREIEVCAYLLKSLTVRQIAGELGLAFATVNGYYRNLYRKLGINSKAELFLLFGVEVSPDVVPVESAGKDAAPDIVVDVQKMRELLTISKL